MDLVSSLQTNPSPIHEDMASSSVKKAILLSGKASAEVARVEREACVAFCDTHGYEVVGEETVADHLVASRLAHGDEPPAAVRASTEGLVYVGYAATRLFRSVEALEAFTESLTTDGATLETVKEGALTPGGLGFLAASARIAYRAAKRDMLAAVARLRIAEGKVRGKLTGRPPIGLIKGKTETGEYTYFPDPEAAEKIATLFRMALDGATMREMVIHAADAGLKAPSGVPLSPSYIQRILRNPVYAGLLKAEDGETLIPGNFKGIITEECFQLVQIALDELRRRRGSN